MLRDEYVRVQAPAKINLGLHVLEKRSDGYHNIETGLIAISLFDELEFSLYSDVSLSCTDPNLSTGPENLCLQAAKLLVTVFSPHEGARIHLTKNIPYGAGLGGGSSDAAATLIGLSHLWNLPVTVKDLYPLAEKLGSDVPFFLNPVPSVAHRRGEQLVSISADHQKLHRLFSFTVVVLVPARSISTREAYRQVKPCAVDRPDLHDLLVTGNLDQWPQLLHNDFEDSLQVSIPEIFQYKARLYEVGAQYASLSGSGSSMYGLFPTRRAAEEAARRLNYPGIRLEIVDPVLG